MRKLALLLVGALAGSFGCDGDDGNDGPVTIALLAPKTGPLSGVGTSFETIFDLAVENINDQGGIDGRDLIGITLDTQLAVDGAPPIDETFRAAVDMGAVGVVGPAASGECTDSYPVAAELHVPMISPSSTAPALSSADIQDDGYLFRNVPDDNIQGIAMSHYLGTVREPAVTNVAVLYEDSDYGDGLRGAFVAEFTGAPVNGSAPVQVAFEQGLADDAAADTAIAELATAIGDAASPPTMIVLIALEQDAIKLTNAWERSANALFDDTEFFMTDGARSADFLTGAPDSLQGMCGTAPTFPVTGLVYAYLEGKFTAANPTLTLDSQVFGPNVWDATHLLAAAAVLQAHEHDGDVGDADFRDAITEISVGGQQFSAETWRDFIGDVRSGSDVDYDGAAGPNDFNAVGQAIGPYEVWCVSDDGTSFDRELFLEAETLQEL